MFLELELINPETLKNEGFGASHRTYQIIPQVQIIPILLIFLGSILQVYELTMMPPSAPLDLMVVSSEVSFSCPLNNGGGNIQNYEVN